MPRLGLALAGVLALSGCVETVKQVSVKSALVDNGISPPVADCMARQMAKKLSIAQLQHLQALGGTKRSWADYVVAVRRVNDPQALEVLVSSLALCKSGMIR
jgi:hypothetical protein